MVVVVVVEEERESEQRSERATTGKSKSNKRESVPWRAGGPSVDCGRLGWFLGEGGSRTGGGEAAMEDLVESKEQKELH